MNTYLPRVLNGIQRVNLFLPAFPFSTPSLESGPLSHKSKPHPTAPRERNRRQVLINFIFFLLLGQWFSTLACTLESPGELLEIPMLRPHPRPIKPGSLGKNWGIRIYIFLRFPVILVCSRGWESLCLGEKGLDHRFTADQMETQIRFKAPISYSRSLKIQPPSYVGALPSCPSFPWFLLDNYLSSFYNDQKKNPRQNLKMLNHNADSLECRPQACLTWSIFSPKIFQV